MSTMNVKFINQDYELPKDLVKYISMQMVTEASISYTDLMFKLKLQSGIEIVDDIHFMDYELESKAAEYIEKLCNSDIYDRTVNDYISSSKGYELVHSVIKDCKNYLVKLLAAKNDAYLSGINDALYRKEAAVTGLDFGIISSSFVNHMIYATMEANAMYKQEKEATEKYNLEIVELRSSLSVYDEKESEYIEKIFVPSMKLAITVFMYEMFDKYISDMIKNNKLDKSIMSFINIERSNDLLKNLKLANNKEAVLRSAFEACPFNIDVYMNAMKYDLLDYDSYKTAEALIYGYKIKDFLEENIGEVLYPSIFKIDYKCAELLAVFTEQDVKDILREKTEPYADGIYKQYIRIIKMLKDMPLVQQIMSEERDETLVSGGEALSQGKAYSYIQPIVSDNIWNQLVDNCGHEDLLDDIIDYIEECPELQTKKDLDQFLTEKLTAIFEEVRKDFVESIKAKEEAARLAIKQAEYRAREETERKAKEKAERKEKAKAGAKKGAKLIIIIIAAIIAFFILQRVWLKIKWDMIEPANDYKEAVSLMENGQYKEAYDLFSWNDDYKDSSELALLCQYNYAKQLFDEAEYMLAAAEFSALADFEDSGALQKECIYLYAVELIERKDYMRALEYLEIIPEYKDVAEQINVAKYNYADDLYNNELYEKAAEEFKKIGDYKDSAKRVNESVFQSAEAAMSQGDYLDAAFKFEELGEYENSVENAKECRYNAAKEYINLFDYENAKKQLSAIDGYKDADEYINLINNLKNKVYYNDEYMGTHYIWLISEINTETCSERSNFFECRDDIGTDDEYVDYYQGHNKEWKASGKKIYASNEGIESDIGYTIYTLSSGQNTLTTQFVNSDGEAGVVDTYKIMPDGRAQYIKEEWLKYLENNESDEAYNAANTTMSTIEFITDVNKTSDGIEFYINGLKWTKPTGWSAYLNDNNTEALLQFSEGDVWGDVHRIYISYEGQYNNLTEYMSKNKTNGSFRKINVSGCSEAYICYEGLLDENQFESNTAYVMCDNSVFKVSYVADSSWYNDTEVNGTLIGADFGSYSYN